MITKTRVVNIISYHEDKRGWRVAVNLPEIPLHTVTMTPEQAREVALYLQGRAYQKDVSSTALNAIYYVRKCVAEDLLIKTAQELNNMAVMAEYYNGMAALAAANPAGTPPPFVETETKSELLQ